MRAGAVRQFRFMAIRALGDSGPPQRIMRPPRGGSSLRVSSFGIRHRSILVMKIPQRFPAVVPGLNRAMTIRLVTVLPAYRADALARVVTDPLHRERQENVLP